MATVRASENPIIRPENVRPSREDFEVIGVFNAGVARYEGEVILLLRVAERPRAQREDVVLSPIYDVDTNEITVKSFARDDPRNDFSDPRLIVAWHLPCTAHGSGCIVKMARDQVAGTSRPESESRARCPCLVRNLPDLDFAPAAGPQPGRPAVPDRR